MKINTLIDHTALKATVQKKDIEKLCEEAIKYKFKSVCVNPCFIEYAKKLLAGSEVLVCTVIGFPLGANTTKAKVYETSDAISQGADEIDMVLNVGALKDGDFDLVLNELKAIRAVARTRTLKVIFETCFLTKEEIIKACELSLEAEVDFVKTSTGFGTDGATVEIVKLMADTVKGNCGVKASGGVKSLEVLTKMVEAGATRIGTSSAVEIIKGESVKSDY